MLKSNRSFSIIKLKNRIKLIDSFISTGEEKLLILTSLGRVFKFDLSNKYIIPTTKQSQGLMIAKILPTEKIVSCCKGNKNENLYLLSKKGKFFNIRNSEIYDSNNSKLGYLIGKNQLKNDKFIKIISNNQYIDIETNKNKSSRINFYKINDNSKNHISVIDFLDLDENEYIENCYSLEKFLH